MLDSPSKLSRQMLESSSSVWISNSSSRSRAGLSNASICLSSSARVVSVCHLASCLLSVKSSEISWTWRKAIRDMNMMFSLKLCLTYICLFMCITLFHLRNVRCVPAYFVTKYVDLFNLVHHYHPPMIQNRNETCCDELHPTACTHSLPHYHQDHLGRMFLLLCHQSQVCLPELMCHILLILYLLSLLMIDACSRWGDDQYVQTKCL